MGQQNRVVFNLILVVLAALLVFLAAAPRAGYAAPAPSPAAAIPVAQTTVFDVNCVSLPVVTPAYSKLVDLATFNVHSEDSVVELTFNGRIFVGSFSSGTGAVFELRVDDAASPNGRARANLRTTEAGGGGRQAAITGIFTDLAPGPHTVSMWVRTSVGGAGTQAMVDPGCWSTDVLLVREFTAIGSIYIPMIQQQP